jgi:ElaB/YqjD/DUF883 family membrane-anchored ribosome-binding protein
MKSKQIMINFLKEKGASAELIAEYERALNEDLANLMKTEAQAAGEKQHEAQQKLQSDISKIAEDISIR